MKGFRTGTRHFVAIMLLLLTASFAGAQELDEWTETWVRHFATEDSSELGHDFMLDPDGNPVVSGFTSLAQTVT
ncbi:hypothetical protein GF324_13600, partial [bacterium]|nr:hypothetical protein [bacterium]